MKKISAIVEARSNSKRLPNKILLKINNKTILEYLLIKLKKSKKLNDIIIATTKDKTDDKIVEIAKNIDFDKVAAIESRGFVFASTVSYLLNKPFVLLRKKNKLPADVHSIDFKLEYGDATIEVHKDSIEKNEKILIIDDLIATGGTAEAAAKLIEISGGKVAAFIFVINLFDLPGNNLLKGKGYKTQSLIEFPGH